MAKKKGKAKQVFGAFLSRGFRSLQKIVGIADFVLNEMDWHTLLKTAKELGVDGARKGRGRKEIEADIQRKLAEQ